MLVGNHCFWPYTIMQQIGYPSKYKSTHVMKSRQTAWYTANYSHNLSQSSAVGSECHLLNIHRWLISLTNTNRHGFSMIFHHFLTQKDLTTGHSWSQLSSSLLRQAAMTRFQLCASGFTLWSPERMPFWLKSRNSWDKKSEQITLMNVL